MKLVAILGALLAQVAFSSQVQERCVDSSIRSQDISDLSGRAAFKTQIKKPIVTLPKQPIAVCHA